MSNVIAALQRKFREGRRAEAIAECEALCRADPAGLALRTLCATMQSVVGNHARAAELFEAVHRANPRDPDVLFNLATCERELGRLQSAERRFLAYVAAWPTDAAGWASLSECRLQLQAFEAGVEAADRAIGCDAACVPAWITRGHCLKALRRSDDALESYRRANAIQPSVEAWFGAGQVLVDAGRPVDAVDALGRAVALAPDVARLRVVRADTLHGLGRLDEAVADYRHVLRVAPTDDETLKKASICLLQAGRGADALELCREIQRAHPGTVTARLGAEWVLSQLVPLWHAPMMNEQERNRAYQDGLSRVVEPGQVVFEVGTGSGLLAMMAARLGAGRVYTCEAVPLIAQTAARIVELNGFADRVTVLARPSAAVRLGEDLPVRADVLVHEIFSSELLGENVLAAIEDARDRLLAPGGRVLPAAASIVIALVGGDALGAYVHVGEAFGFDLRPFNAIHPKKVPLHREDLQPVLLSDPVDALRFDFQAASRHPPERRTLSLPVTGDGTCHGVIQWIRIEVADGVGFENHPLRPRRVTNWQHTVYAFERPIELTAGSRVSVLAMHDRTRPWFSLEGVTAAGTRGG